MKRVAILLLLVLRGINTHAYDNEKVHQLINESAAMQSANFNITMNQLGFQGLSPSEIIELNVVNNRTIKYWIREGAKQEDVPDCRSKYHFHDPTKTFDTAGLSNAAINITCLNMNNESSLMWSQHQDNPWSWQKGREYYYQALTAVDKNEREQRFADTFRAVGQVMHLLADASVPEHTRNDIHIFPWFDKADKSFPQIGSWTYETWCKQHAKNLNIDATAQDYRITSTSVVSGLQPIFNLWDTTPLPITGNYIPVGLAEYSNYNFLSSDTIFKDYVYPINPAEMSGVLKIVAAEDGRNDKRVYFSSMTSDNKPIEHLVSTGYLWSDLDNISPYNMDKAKFNLDDNCYKDYADILVPKAVSYSAALLDYFFRGTLEISYPSSVVYSIADGSKTPYAAVNGNQHQQFTKLNSMVMNTTPNGEAIKAGTLTAVARYKIIPNYASDLSSYPPDGAVMKAVPYSYSVSLPSSVNEGDIIPGYYTDFTFDFSGSPIPAGITDLTLQIVFKGTIGNEVGNAIAVGMRDLMEPTHLTFWNSSDMFNLLYSGSAYFLYTFDQLRQKAAADANFFNYIDFNHSGSLYDDLILQPFNSTFTISFWDGFDWVPATTVDIPPARHIRLVALVDSNKNNYVNMEYTYPGGSSNAFYPFEGVVNQASQDGTYPDATKIETFRKSVSASGAFASFFQHFSQSVVGCHPVQIVGVNGEPISCPYADEAALPIESVSPIAFPYAFE